MRSIIVEYAPSAIVFENFPLLLFNSNSSLHFLQEKSATGRLFLNLFNEEHPHPGQ